jgi:HTH-type transcriptional regulator/antitoxin HipB
MEISISCVADLGTALARARKSAEKTQAEIAKQANLRQATVSKVENGDQGVRLETVLSLLQASDLELLVRPKQR